MPRDDSPGGDRGSWGGSGRDQFQQRQLPPAHSELDKIDKEKLEVLDGTRSSKPEILRRSAVRIADLNGILQLPHDQQSLKLDPAGPAPTAAQYNQLQLDVFTLHQQLMTVAAELRRRITP